MPASLHIRHGLSDETKRRFQRECFERELNSGQMLTFLLGYLLDDREGRCDT